MSFNKNFLSKSPLASHGGPHSGEEKWKQQKANYDKYQNQLNKYKVDSTSYVDKLKKFENFQNSKTKYPDYYTEGLRTKRKRYDNAVNYIKEQSKKGKLNPEINYSLLNPGSRIVSMNSNNALSQKDVLKNFSKNYVPKPTKPTRPVEVKNPGSSYKTKPNPGERVYKEYSYIGPGSFSIDPVTRQKVIKNQTAKSLMSK